MKLLASEGLEERKMFCFEGAASLSSKQAKNHQQIIQITFFLKSTFVTKDSKNSIGFQNLHWF